MEWLNHLLGVDAPAGTVLESADLGFRGLFPWPFAVLLVLLLGVFVALLYWREASRVNIVMRGLMGVVRVAIIFFLFLLLSPPLLLSELRAQRPRGAPFPPNNTKRREQRDRRTTTADVDRVFV